MNSEIKKVFIVDDHPVVRQGLSMIINEEEDLTVCGQTGNANEAIKSIGDMEPDIALVDITLEGSASGLDLVKSIQKRFPSIPTLVISMHDDKLYAERAMMAGAKGYLMKSEAEGNIVGAIRTVLAGDLYLNKDTSINIVSKMLHGSTLRPEASIDRLTDREFEILRLLGQGLGTRKIAQELNISVNTVETHRRHIRKKLDLKDSDELVRYAIQWYIDSQK